MFGPWADPERRVVKYLMPIAYRFHLDPRQIDRMTINEFDQFARQCDAFDEEERKHAAR